MIRDHEEDIEKISFACLLSPFPLVFAWRQELSVKGQHLPALDMSQGRTSHLLPLPRDSKAQLSAQGGPWLPWHMPTVELGDTSRLVAVGKRCTAPVTALTLYRAFIIPQNEVARNQDITSDHPLCNLGGKSPFKSLQADDMTGQLLQELMLLSALISRVGCLSLQACVVLLGWCRAEPF